MLIAQDAARQAKLETIETKARNLVALAQSWGVVLTVEQKPLKPLAMGNYESVVTVREARK